MFYAKNVAGGANTVTATFANCAQWLGRVYVHEYSGVDKVEPARRLRRRDRHRLGDETASVTTSNASDLLFSARGVLVTGSTAGGPASRRVRPRSAIARRTGT